ncbi:hypothetical protein [Neorhizobium sp. JUb45]|uniref:hypothetical protein n=1 Tax=unclassified Neorhizobium TaxID=2629175 RepID=UPI0010513454|nr:hypothetical protein [Neorhizobium sp. JUb45]TCQ96344.1 hypothetical protein EDF70_1161 [Neorhizobium sp. JUb45]
MRTKSMCLWLSALAIPVFILVAVQVDKPSSPSIGGGGYDLGPLVYSWLLIMITVLWSVCTFVAAVNFKDRASSKRAFILMAMGIITFTVVLLVYHDNLS